MHTPEKRKYYALKEAMKMIDCEVMVAFQGFAETWDEDDDRDDDMISVGTESSTASVRDLIEIISKEGVTARKLDGTQLRLWLPRGTHYNGYRWKDSITRRLRVSQITGYEEKQILAYITANGLPPILQEAAAEEEEQEDQTGGPEEQPEEADPQPFSTPRPSPAKTELRDSPTDSKASKRRKVAMDMEDSTEEQPAAQTEAPAGEEDENMDMDAEEGTAESGKSDSKPPADAETTGTQLEKVSLV